MKRLTVLVLVLCMMVSLAGWAGAEDAPAKGYGYIDRDGKVVLEPQFQYAYAFTGDRARIFSGKMSSYGYYPDEGLYGYIDRSGKEVIPLIYEEAGDFAENGKACVCRNGKYGIIDVNGETVVDFAYDYISYDSDQHKYKAFVGTMTSYGSPESGTYTILDDDCKELCTVTTGSLYMYDGHLHALKDKKYAIWSYDGEQLTDYVYDSIGDLSDSLVSFSKDGGDTYGYMNLKGETVISPEYKRAGKFMDGKAIVQKGSTYCLIDSKNQVLKTYKADYMDTNPDSGYTSAFEGTLSDYGFPKEGVYHLTDLDGNYIGRGYKKGDCYSVSKGIWRVKEGNTWYALDMEGNELFSVPNCESLYTCGEDRFVAKCGDRYALLDFGGNLLTDYVWDNMITTSGDLIPVYSAGNEPDFRSVRWGMTEEEVKAAEGSSPDYSGKLDGKNARYIAYDTTLMGNSVIVAYYFAPAGLYEARYIWTENHSNDSLYITDYNNIKAQLTKKYGSPWWDKENWDTTSHQKYYADNKGNALSFGYLSFETDYNTPRTEIGMRMSADNYTVSFIIYYDSRSISAPEEDYSDQL